MLKTYFDELEVFLLISAGISFIISIAFFLKEKEKPAVFFLLLATIFVFCFAALLDPFLNIYDERFHALVAKNLSLHPFKPTLYDNPVITMAYDYWDKYHIWLHKQPLFLWQMALSYKLFGPSEFAIRIPSIVLGSVLVMTTYRSGKLMVNSSVGYIAAILLMTSFYFIELVAGRLVAEHNDVAFITYISLSFWSLIEYNLSGKRYWIFLLGLFSGLAILNKWLVGLVVYFLWVLYKFLRKKFQLQDYKDILQAFLITIIIALPWQIFIFLRYPEETLQTYSLNTKHFFDVVEGHSGDFWFHFNHFDMLFGNLSSFLIIPALIALYLLMSDKRFFFSLAGMIGMIYLFFSLAKTKMPSFPFIVLMPVFIALAALCNYLINYLPPPHGWYKKLIFTLIVLFLVLTRFNLEAFQEKHTLWKKENLYTPALLYNKELFLSLDLPENAVIFNVRGQHYVEAMYYTGLPAYRIIPSWEHYNEMKNKGLIIAIFSTGQELPDYLKNDSSVIIINKKIEGYD